jgi:hypothetical protein
MTSKHPTTHSDPDAPAEQQTAAQRQALARLQGLAAERGVKPLTSDELLTLGNLWPEDESIDEFLAALQEQRRDGTMRRIL